MIYMSQKSNGVAQDGNYAMRSAVRVDFVPSRANNKKHQIMSSMRELARQMLVENLYGRMHM